MNYHSNKKWKSICLLMFVYFFSNAIQAQIVNIPDANFKAALVGNAAINTNLDTEIQVSEAVAFSDSIFVNNLNIADLTGIESFVNIILLDCNSNQLTSLDVTANTALKYLDCGSNQLGSIDVSYNTVLTTLGISNNWISTIDLSNNPDLITLSCQGNQFTVLDLSNNVQIAYVDCSVNYINTLDFSANVALSYLFCYANQLTSLNIQNGNNLNLSSFQAMNNSALICIQVDNFTFMNSNWSAGIDATADFSNDCSCLISIPDANFKNALLSNLTINTDGDTFIQCAEASAFTGTINVEALGINDLTGIEAFTEISDLNCSNNALTTIDISSNTSMLNFSCANNQISSLNLTSNPSLLLVNCASNQLTSLNTNSNINLQNLRFDGNNISNLDLSVNLNLNALYCNNTNIGTLDLSFLNNLAYFECSNNPIASLNIQNGNNSNLLIFNATNNPNLTCIQVDNFNYMTTNWAAAIDATAGYSTNCSCIVNIPDANFKTALLANAAINTNGDAFIQCNEASAYTGAIDVSNLSIADLTGIESFLNIDTLVCVNNLLTSLDVSSNTQLIYICFSSNQLTSIDLSSNTLLIELCGQFNQLTSIDVSANTALKYLYLSSNQLSNLDVSSNSALWYLAFAINNISAIDVTNCPELFELNCSNNQITSLDLSSNTDMYYVYCDHNLISNLDLSTDTSLVILNCNNNNLFNLNIQNGNNADITTFNATNNPFLTCVQVDDVALMNTNWSSAIDAVASYSLYCDPCANIPTPQFSISSNNFTSAPATATFTNNTPNLGLFDFLWHFGDGSALNKDNVTYNHTYQTNGRFYVSLTINDPFTGCSITTYDPANTSQTVVCNVPTANVCGFTPTISPNGVINACQGSLVNLTLTPGSYPPGSIIQWNKNGVTAIGENYSNHYVSEDGFYTATVFSPTGCPVVSAPVQVIFSLPANIAPTISSTGTSGPCGQNNLSLTANGSFGSYIWNTGQTGNTINITAAGVYSVTGQSGVGCNLTSLPLAVSTSTFATPEICMVDVDSLTNHAVIIWDKPMVAGITGFGIYKETPLYSDNYQQIAVVPYDSLSEYMDLSSDESIISERYRISIIDTCLGESSFSAPARAIGLKVIPGINNQRVLTWNHYVSSTPNFTEYDIYSGSAINQLSYLATVPASINSNYIDANPVNGINTIYKIYADMIIPCESTRAVRNRSVSNGNGNFQTPFIEPTVIEEHELNSFDFTIVPNPSNGKLNLIIKNDVSKETKVLYVYDILGHLLYQKQIENNYHISIDLSHLENAVYNLKIVGSKAEVNKRFLIAK